MHYRSFTYILDPSSSSFSSSSFFSFYLFKFHSSLFLSFFSSSSLFFFPSFCHFYALYSFFSLLFLFSFFSLLFLFSCTFPLKRSHIMKKREERSILLANTKEITLSQNLICCAYCCLGYHGRPARRWKVRRWVLPLALARREPRGLPPRVQLSSRTRQRVSAISRREVPVPDRERLGRAPRTYSVESFHDKTQHAHYPMSLALPKNTNKSGLMR